MYVPSTQVSASAEEDLEALNKNVSLEKFLLSMFQR